MSWRDWVVPWSRKAANAYDILRELVSQRSTASGKTVNAKTAVEVSTVYACMRVLGEGVAQVPLKLMKASADGKTRLEARDHPLFEVLGTRPNAWQTSFEWREMVVWHVGLAGNHYSYINRGRGGRILELIPFAPGAVTPRRMDDYSLRYDVFGLDGKAMTFTQDQIWHLKGPSWEGWLGLEAVKIARESIGLAMATEQQQASLQKNGVTTTGTYSVEGVLRDEQQKQILAWIQRNTGSGNAGGVLVLDRGAKWNPTTMTGVDAQTIETRRMQIEEICRFCRVNPIMVGAESKNTTYASAEQMFLAHLVHTLAPWYARIEQSIDANLLTEADRAAGIYANFVEEGLLRGSATATKDVILGYVNGGIMTPNEGRAKMDMNPDADPENDKLRIPANLVGAADKQPIGAPA